MQILKKLVFLIMLFLTTGFLLQLTSAVEMYNATVVDMQDLSTEVYDLGRDCCPKYFPTDCWHKNFIIKRGNATLTIPFKAIKQADFDWISKPPTAKIIYINEEIITGEPAGSCSLTGNAGLAQFSQAVGETKRVIFHQTTNTREAVYPSSDVTQTPPEIDMNESNQSNRENVIPPNENISISNQIINQIIYNLYLQITLLGLSIFTIYEIIITIKKRREHIPKLPKK
ncbi:hypothetical protein M0R72_16575 [Candidatus Pacearchaeota archaeon]|jgi:hypothetical protein|nr:hypothetical protein [Candidatus Pacearchaeota archaeon]